MFYWSQRASLIRFCFRLLMFLISSFQDDILSFFPIFCLFSFLLPFLPHYTCMVIYSFHFWVADWRLSYKINSFLWKYVYDAIIWIRCYDLDTLLYFFIVNLAWLSSSIVPLLFTMLVFYELFLCFFSSSTLRTLLNFMLCDIDILFCHAKCMGTQYEIGLDKIITIF